MSDKQTADYVDSRTDKERKNEPKFTTTAAYTESMSPRLHNALINGLYEIGLRESLGCGRWSQKWVDMTSDEKAVHSATADKFVKKMFTLKGLAYMGERTVENFRGIGKKSMNVFRKILKNAGIEFNESIGDYRLLLSKDTERIKVELIEQIEYLCKGKRKKEQVIDKIMEWING